MKPYRQKLTYNSSTLNSSLDFQNPKTYLPLQTHRDPTFHLGQYHSIPTPTKSKAEYKDFYLNCSVCLFTTSLKTNVRTASPEYIQSSINLKALVLSEQYTFI